MKYQRLFLLVLVFVFAGYSQTSISTSVTVSVLDSKGGSVGGLKKDSFVLKENGLRQEILTVEEIDLPVSVVILFDVSGSIRKNELGVHIDSARRFIKESNSSNEYSVFSFNSKTNELQNWTKSSKSIDAAFDSILTENRNLFGQTSLDDAILKAIEQFEKAKHKSKLLLVFSDGQENFSSRKSKKLADKIIKANDIVIHSMYCFRCGKNTDNPNNEYAISEISTDLERYCETAGGKFYFPKSEKEATESIVEIVNYFNSRYNITYNSTNQKKSKSGWQKVEIKASSAKIKNLIVHSRKGYFAN